MPKDVEKSGSKNKSNDDDREKSIWGYDPLTKTKQTHKREILLRSLKLSSIIPIEYARGLTGRQRTTKRNQHLGFTLAFVAGAANAGGFLAVNQYTSHMTGIVSSIADNLALGLHFSVIAGSVGLLSFLLGSISSTIMINYARRRQMNSEYALPLLLEAILLSCFGVLGAQLAGISGLLVPVTVMLLCYIMGLQNAVVTKLSNAVIRTTHITGIVTDIGIELGKLIYWNSADQSKQPRVVADKVHLKVLLILFGSFLGGAIAGAFGFKKFGYSMTIPLALILVITAALPAVDDFTMMIQRVSRKG